MLLQTYLTDTVGSGPGRVINRSDFNTVVSQGLGRPEERKRDGDSVYRLSLPSYMDVVCGTRYCLMLLRQ